MLPASVIKQICLYGNLLVGLEKDVCPEFTNRFNLRACAVDMVGKPGFIVGDAFEYPLRQRGLLFIVWNPVETDPLSFSCSRKLSKVIYNMSIINVIHATHE